jgi:hypothetical protein
MTLTPEATQALYADPSGQSLSEQLTAAYQRNLEGGVATPSAGDSLLSVAATAVAEARATAASDEVVPLAGLSPEFGDLLASKHRQAELLFGRISVDVPSMTEFARAGFDLPKLDRSFEAMTRKGLAPELVLAPVLPQEQWVALFQDLQDDPSVNHDNRIQNGGLYIDNDVSSHWDELEATDHTTSLDGQDWQVLVVPGTPKPPVLNVDHTGSDGKAAPSRMKLGRRVSGSALAEQLTNQATELGLNPESLTADNLHPTISAYLSLQAAQLEAAQPPLDASTWSWLHGTFDASGTLRAPSGRWSSVVGQVGLGWYGVDNRSGHLGVRLPVWGEA